MNAHSNISNSSNLKFNLDIRKQLIKFDHPKYGKYVYVKYHIQHTYILLSYYISYDEGNFILRNLIYIKMKVVLLVDSCVVVEQDLQKLQVSIPQNDHIISLLMIKS